MQTSCWTAFMFLSLFYLRVSQVWNELLTSGALFLFYLSGGFFCLFLIQSLANKMFYTGKVVWVYL